ncbi:MAG: DUF1343 domain-containing protein, partial [Chitinophagaceae bacterium]|nr:DUF1343 domain-containing protein [Chitinophagaceae bacterium]
MTKLFLSLFFIAAIFSFGYTAARAQSLPGAYNTQEYLPLLKNKRVGVFANQTSVIGNVHVVDSLRNLGVNITKIFGPEHGFRGVADAGEKVDTYIDTQTGIPVVSLYGKKSKPSADDLQDVDVLLFDLQDVGTRFYTYINSLQGFIESAIDNNKQLIILDRPNPNGFYIDGPVLEKGYESGVGKQPVPIVYGMTIGEYGLMLIGEKWLSVAADYRPEKVNVKVIKCSNYTHRSRYVLPVKPSPNLPDMQAVYRYPSTCFFEGTVLSEGRGTAYPFQIFGHPSLPDSLFRFVPESTPGATNPKLKGQTCYGWNLHEIAPSENKIELQWLLQ